MKFNVSRNRTIFLIAGGLVIAFLIWYFINIVTYILISVVFSFIGRPLMRWFRGIRFRRFSIPDSLSSLVTLTLLWTVFVSFFSFIIPLLMTELDALSNVDFNSVLDVIEEPVSQLVSFFRNEPVSVNNQSLIDLLREKLAERIDFSKLSNLLGFVAGTIGDVAIAFFSISFITFFFLKDEKMFTQGILLIVPTEMEEKVKTILSSISYLLRRYFIGVLLEIFMVMMLDTLGLLIAGIAFNHAIVIGLFCGLFVLIPYVGPWIGSAIGLLIGLTLNIGNDFMTETLPVLSWMAVVFLSVKILDNLLFQPLIYASSVKAHPLEIFLVILAAGSVAGVLGMFLAVPVYTIIRVIAKEFFDNLKIVKKITENLNEVQIQKDQADFPER